MKKNMLVAGLFQIVVALVLAAPAIAQQNTYLIDIPFSFNVNGTVLPAGEYRVDAVAPALAEIHGVDRSNLNSGAKFTTFRQYRPAGGTLVAQLVFHRYTQQYFLAEAWFDGSPSGYMLPRSHAEQEYARQISNSGTVMLAAK
jgi:hypothetical protein